MFLKHCHSSKEVEKGFVFGIKDTLKAKILISFAIRSLEKLNHCHRDKEVVKHLHIALLKTFSNTFCSKSKAILKDHYVHCPSVMSICPSVSSVCFVQLKGLTIRICILRVFFFLQFYKWLNLKELMHGHRRKTKTCRGTWYHATVSTKMS